MDQRPRFLPLCMALLLVFFSAQQIIAQEGSDKKVGPAGKAKFVSLFNGKDLDDWIQRGGKAKYTIEGDTIVGTSVVDTPNTFLCTPRDYADFILEVEVKIDNHINSGIQIRSQVRGESIYVESQNEHGNMVIKKIAAGRVFGYQVEIDPSDRAFSGGIYDEARRGWLFDLKGEKSKSARKAFQRGKWNKYRIEAIGNSIKTWINGVPVADLTDDVDASGFIALQVHSIGKKEEGKQVRWRNIRIQ
ncbi:MAG: DUF1080 domain-containing protein [Pirellulales bacterium]|nr:DUF1080 domain-containing protein [Pirellulales bacterium]